MINVNELRKGNLVLVDHVESYYARILELPLLRVQKNNGESLLVSDGIIEPLPLTPEWLERCGLKQQPLEPDDLPQWSNLNMNIAQYTDGFYLYTITSDPWHNRAVGRKIEFVHHLQNIYLDLTGEELNVKL